MRKRNQSVEIDQDEDSVIWIWQWNGENDVAIILQPNQARKLAHRLMSFAAGQGPREKETIEDTMED